MKHHFPIEGYHFYKQGNRVIAISTYAGRTVRGVAICADGDEFDWEYGKRLAAARCNYKVAQKRRARALNKTVEAAKAIEAASAKMTKYRQYYWDASQAVLEAGTELDNIVAERTEI